MCYQFDVYRNPSAKTCELHPYLMVIQHDYYDDLSTRLILPLSYRNNLSGHINPAAALINIDFLTLFMNTPGITSVEKKKLTNNYYVTNMQSARTRVVAVIDALITNT
ncbi:CcdB family protein [Leclercia adecarboxylata]|uniref:CcdB family protein n=1 Tax=Leclercia adecarboxylata TaxID=83655 RepID=UPI002029B8D9|nr:CcdB family protein [Leclercia adecarboxylata]URO01404.1 CcdB family protein [Leclercia adecarboxylata]